MARGADRAAAVKDDFMAFGQALGQGTLIKMGIDDVAIVVILAFRLQGVEVIVGINNAKGAGDAVEGLHIDRACRVADEEQPAPLFYEALDFDDFLSCICFPGHRQNEGFGIAKFVGQPRIFLITARD